MYSTHTLCFIMKKISVFLLTIAIMLPALCIPITGTSGFEFILSGDGYILTGYTGTDQVVTVSDSYGGMPVVGIGEDAFAKAISAYKIILPATLTEIAPGAFSCCASLACIEAEEGVFYSSEGVLYSSGSLIAYPAAREGAFDLPEGITKIAERAFYGTHAITEADVSGSVSIGKEAFAHSSLTRVTLSENTDIGEYAFFNSALYGELIIPAGCNAGGFAFSGTSVSRIEARGDISEGAFAACTELYAASLSSDVPGGAFSGCSKLVSVYAPMAVSVDNGAFYGCGMLEYVTLAKDAEIASDAFSLCPEYSSFEGESSVTGAAFASDTMTLSVNESKSAEITVTPEGTQLRGYTLIPLSDLVVCNGGTVSAVRSGTATVMLVTCDGAFADYLTVYIGDPDVSYITEISGPATVTMEAGGEFTPEISYQPSDAYPVELRYVSSDTSVVTVSSGGVLKAVSGGVATVTVMSVQGGVSHSISVTVTEQSENGFVYKTDDKGAKITKYRGTSTDVSVPSEIGGYTVYAIAKTAFEYNTAVVTVSLPSTVTTVESGSFAGCTSLTAINVDSGNTAYSSISGALFNKGGTTLVAVPAGTVGAYTVPSGCKIVSAGAFSHCMFITSVSLPQTVTSIYASAFDRCVSLKEVNAVAGSYVSEGGVLYNAAKTNLVYYPGAREGDFTIPDTVTIIASGAFKQCTYLKNVTISKSVKSISSGAFSDSLNIDHFTVASDNAYYTGVGGVIYNKAVTELVAVPPAYEGTLEIPSGVTSIGNSAMANCYGIDNVIIPDTVVNIYGGAFLNCGGISDIILPQSVKYVASGAFTGCTASVYFPMDAVMLSDISVGDMGILCEQGSYAHEYAIARNVPYTPVHGTFGNGYIAITKTLAQCSIAGTEDIPAALIKAAAGYTDTEYIRLDYLYGEYAASGKESYIYIEKQPSKAFALYGGRVYTLFLAEKGTGTVLTVPNGAVIALVYGERQEEQTQLGAYGMPYKTEYACGSEFDPAGLELYYTDEYGITRFVTDEATYEYSFDTPGTSTVTVNYLSDQCYISVTVINAVISGTLGLKGNAYYGQTLTIDISGIAPDNASYSVTWYRSDSAISGANSASYVLTRDDIGCNVRAEITGNNGYEGSVSSNSVTVEKAPQTNAEPVVVESMTASSVTLKHRDGYEYRISGGEYGDSNVFEGLTPGRSYTFYQRIKETDTHKASERTSLYVTLEGYSSITSDVYFINRAGLKISRIEPGTTVSEMLSGINERDYVKVYKNGSQITGNALIGTGCVLKLEIGDEVIDSLTAVITGDINGDGKITLTDYANLKTRILANTPFDGAKESACDINGDGKTTLTDYARLKMHLLGTREITQLEY